MTCIEKQQGEDSYDISDLGCKRNGMKWRKVNGAHKNKYHKYYINMVKTQPMLINEII